jgi:DNA processing protein
MSPLSVAFSQAASGGMNATIDLVTLTLLPGGGPRRWRDLLGRAPVCEVLARPDDHLDLLGEEGVRRLAAGEAARAAGEEMSRAAALGIRIVGLDEPEYPARLRQVYDPPPVLYVKGVLEAGDLAPAVAVVGARSSTPAGRALARGLARDLAGWGVTIVSGLARGIDGEAHQGALDAGGRTVAVLGSGLDRLYPPEHAGLARAVERSGALVSEFPLGTAPLPQHFPRRNRIIAGWSQAVVVVEAARRSGALNTARTALDEGRDVMAVPGHPAQAQAEGTNQLIRDGAALVRNAQDVAEELGLEVVETAPATAPAGLAGVLPLHVPTSLEELQRRSGLETPALLARLTELELKDEVRRLPGALYVRHH